MIKTYKTFYIRLFTVSCLVAVFALSPVVSQAVPTDKRSGERERVNRIKDAVIKELQKSGALDQAIDAGIERYVRKQNKKQARAPNERAKKVRPVSKKRDHIFGNPNAEVSLIEYSDFECPFCKRFHPTPKKVVKAYDGRVNWVYRHFPLGFHNPGAQKQAEASECAAELGGNDAFWKYSDLIYQRTSSNGNGFPIDKLAPLAVEIGLDKKSFLKCFNSGRYTKRVQDDLANGALSGVTGTPGNILLNNKTGAVKAMAGAIPFKKLKTAIDRLLKKN